MIITHSYQLEDNQENHLLLNSKEIKLNSPFKTSGTFQYRMVMVKNGDDDEAIDIMTLTIEVSS